MNKICLIGRLTKDVELKATGQGKYFAFAKLNDNLDIKVIIFNNHLNALKDDNININVYQDIDDPNFYFAIEVKINHRKTKFIYAEIDNNLEGVYLELEKIFQELTE